MTEFFDGLGMGIVMAGLIVLIGGAVFLGLWLGRRVDEDDTEDSDIGTLTAGALGLLALLIAFSFSISLSAYDNRRTAVIEEATAIESAADNALMLPEPQRSAALALLRDYAATRASLGARYDPRQLARDEARSVDLLTAAWNQAVAASAAAPQSLPVRGFAQALDNVIIEQGKRIAARHYHQPLEVVAMLVGTAMVAMGFTGYHTGVAGGRRLGAALIMVVTVAFAILLIVDLDRPSRGLIRTPRQALIDAAGRVADMARAASAPEAGRSTIQQTWSARRSPSGPDR